MGFYDRDAQPRPKRLSTLWTAIISAMIGGLVVGFILTPVFFWYNSSHTDTLSSETEQIQTTTVTSNSDVTKAVANVSPAVVGVINLSHNQNNYLNRQDTNQGTGSGIIFKKTKNKAYVVTNYHVIAGGSKIQVKLSHNKQTKVVDAKVLGSDQTTDLAVLEIDAQYVQKVAQLGNAKTLQAGETAIAIGNPLGLESSVTVGVISAPKRTIQISQSNSMEVIQTDAAINPGNSGGALINIAGQVVGINSLKIAESGVEGLGFAIPINQAIPILEKLIAHGHVPRPYLGVSLVDLKNVNPSLWTGELQLPATVQSGVVVQAVSPGTPAATALRSRDVIVKLDNQTIQTAAELQNYLYNQKSVHSSLKITFYRDGQLQTVTVKLAATPKSDE